MPQFSPFGEPKDNELVASPLSIGFGGMRFSGDLPFYHTRVRSYRFDVGRFIQRDPAGEIDEPNLYTYARNNPIAFWDPTGFQSLDVDLALDVDPEIALDIARFEIYAAARSGRIAQISLAKQPSLWSCDAFCRRGLKEPTPTIKKLRKKQELEFEKQLIESGSFSSLTAMLEVPFGIVPIATRSAQVGTVGLISRSVSIGKSAIKTGAVGASFEFGYQLISNQELDLEIIGAAFAGYAVAGGTLSALGFASAVETIPSLLRIAKWKPRHHAFPMKAARDVSLGQISKRGFTRFFRSLERSSKEVEYQLTKPLYPDYPSYLWNKPKRTINQQIVDAYLNR
jgi:RHS repeat-associated protein